MRIKRTVEKLVNQYETRNPYEIAEKMGILVQKNPLGGIRGYYLLYSGIKCICVNSEIKDIHMEYTVMAHELGHAVLHKKGICYYVGGITLNLKDKNEVEANTFAAELLIPNSVIKDNADMTIEQLSALSGINKKLFEFKR